MPLLKTLTTFVKQRWLRLSTYSGARRLSLFSLLLLFGLDLYVLGLTFQGMHQVTRSIEYPQSSISSGCAAMTEEFLPLEPDDRVERLRRFVLRPTNDQREPVIAAGFSPVEPLPLCAQVRDTLRGYVDNPELTALYETLAQRQQDIYALQREIDELKASYDSALLEKVARQKRDNSILPVEATQLKRVLGEKTTELAALQQMQLQTRHDLATHRLTESYVALVTALPVAAEFQSAREVFQRQTFWHPLLTFAARLTFLLPLLGLALLWNRHALVRGQDIPTLISSHLILVSALPIFVELVRFIYWLLPHRLLADLMAALERLNLGFVWNYVAILGGIPAGVALIYLAQKTLFSPARQRGLRLRKGLCCDCGEPLNHVDQAHCEFCGAEQTMACPQCGEMHRKLAFHCRRCGAAVADIPG